MFDLGGGELLLILVAVLLLFGPKKLPELAQGLGKGLRQFRKAQQDFSEQINTAFYEEQRKENIRKSPAPAEHTIARSTPSVSIPTGASGPVNDEEKGFAPVENGEDNVEKVPENSIIPPTDHHQEQTGKEKGEEPAS